MATDGAKILGQGKSKPVSQASRPVLAIGCFIDGTGNNESAHSNIQKMYAEAKNHSDKVSPLYFPGPGANPIDVEGILLAGRSMQIAENAYASIVTQYQLKRREGSPSPRIDIFGFSRGAAIANEVAWLVDTKGIQLADGTVVVPPHGAKIRFLGLFETVHSIGGPNVNTSHDFHNTHIAPNVEHAAHALAYDEDRNYFIPSIVKPMPGKNKPRELIFPGVHSDVGGHDGNNQDIMTLTRSWMSQIASQAGVDYLDALQISETERLAILNDPSRVQPGPPGFPQDNFFVNDSNPLYQDHLQTEKINGMPVLQQVMLRGVAAAITPVDPLDAQRLKGGPDTYALQPEKMHTARRFPSEIPRILPEPFMP